MTAAAWPGSNRAAGWLRRREAVALFRDMAELCTDVANALDRHSDTGALECFARLTVKMGLAAKLPCFPPMGVRREMGAYLTRQGSREGPKKSTGRWSILGGHIQPW